MKVKLLCGVTGPRGTWLPKQIIELPGEEAQRFIAGGLAVEIRAEIENAALHTTLKQGRQDARTENRKNRS